jgi:histone deacetylase complex regulatory component SIN3
MFKNVILAQRELEITQSDIATGTSDNGSPLCIQKIEKQEDGGTLEYGHAISYVNSIKHRFADRPAVYKKFLEILQDYEWQPLPTTGVYVEIAELFRSEPDLRDEFKLFMPGFTDAARTTSIEYAVCRSTY